MSQVSISGGRYLSHSKGDPERMQHGHVRDGDPRAKQSKSNRW